MFCQKDCLASFQGFVPGLVRIQERLCQAGKKECKAFAPEGVPGLGQAPAFTFGQREIPPVQTEKTKG